jgi:hypothetical protein
MPMQSTPYFAVWALPHAGHQNRCSNEGSKQAHLCSAQGQVLEPHLRPHAAAIFWTRRIRTCNSAVLAAWSFHPVAGSGTAEATPCVLVLMCCASGCRQTFTPIPQAMGETSTNTPPRLVSGL